MSAAVAEPSVAKPVRVFVARRTDLRLVKEPIETRWGPNGRNMGKTQGESVQFIGGRFEVPTADGATVKLEDGRTLDAAEFLEWIEAHPMLGNIEEGFIEFHAPPPEPSSFELEQLQALAIDHDLDGLEAFAAAEREGFARAGLLTVVDGTIERVKAAQAKAAAREHADHGFGGGLGEQPGDSGPTAPGPEPTAD